MGGFTRALMSVLLLGVPATLTGVIGYQMGTNRTELAPIPEDTLAQWQHELEQQRSAVEASRKAAELELRSLTTHMASVEARIQRLDAAGERILKQAKVKNADEFDFNQPVAVGGPDESIELDVASPSLLESIRNLNLQIDRREQQLETLASLLGAQEKQQDTYISGRPIRKGWMSSPYGYRTDPFHGRRAWHNGVDFAGDEGGAIQAVAGGVVTWSGPRYGYGKMVELDHGNGFKSRYAHNKENLVDVGELISKGDQIAVMGSTGRSTGPHVHFELYKNGRAVDPATYVRRNPR